MCVQIQNGYDFFCFFAYFFPSYVYLRNIHSAVSIIAYIRSQQLLFALNCSKKHFFLLIKHMAALFGKNSVVI